MPKTRVSIPKKKIQDFCHRWNVRELDLFGSALRPDFSQESDVDILISFQQGAGISAFDLAAMQSELESIFGRHVDLVEKEALRNPYRKREILNTARVIYAS
jgi:uncharacterized protein